MTEAETTESKATQDFGDCCVCKENGPGTPTFLLSCLHSVCKPCSDSARLNDNDGADDEIKCATCGVTTPRYDFIENRFLKPSSLTNLGSSEGASASLEEKICTGCEENVPATSYCIECQEYLCDQCVQAHRRVKVTKEHNIQLKENAPTGGGSPNQTNCEVIYCHIHSKEPLKLFCETCDKLTCRDCQLSEHKDHKYYFVEEAGVKMRAVLVRFLERMKEKKMLVENAKQLMVKRNHEIQECQDKVSNDIKVFALKIIAEINRRGKSLMEDLTALCNAKKHQLDQKTEDINLVCRKLDHAVKFVEYCTDKGSPEALLYSKRVLVKQLKGILVERCDVPNPHHKLDIRFQWDQNFISMVPKQGVLLVDGINFHTASKTAQQNWIQGLGLMSGQPPVPQPPPPQPQQLPPQQQPSSKPHQVSGGNHHQSHPGIGSVGGPMMNLTREQRSMNKTRMQQNYGMMVSQASHQPQQQQHLSHQGRAFLQPAHPGQISPTNSSAATQPFLGSQSNRSTLMHPPGYLGGQGPPPPHAGPAPSQFNPHQSSAISSSDPHSRNRPGLGPFHNMSGNGYPLSSRSFQGHQGHDYRSQRPLTLAELQEKHVLMRKKQGHFPPGAPPPSPIVIAPEGEEHSGHLMPMSAPRAPPPSSLGPRRTSVSPHSSNTSSPVHVGSTTSPEQQRPRSASSDSDITVTSVSSKNKLKGEGNERPSCSYSTSPKPSQVEKSDRGKSHPVSISDFTFDQDPMSFIKNINQEIDLNPENTLGLITEKRTSNNNSNEASANHSVASTTSSNQSNATAESHDTDVSSNQSNRETSAASSGKHDESNVGSSNGSLITGKASSHIISTQESSDPNEDWCAVCHNGGDLLCCDYCPKVFHLSCHVPTLKEMPTGSWQCNMCKENLALNEPDNRSAETSSTSGATKRKHVSGLTERELKVCQRILLELYSQESSSPFHQPVSKQVPNYYKVITNPMDFSTIKSRLRRSNVAHYASVEQYLMDVQTVFTNCARYNGVESEMGVIGRDVEQFFHGLVRKYLSYIDIQPVSAGVNNNSAPAAAAAVSRGNDENVGAEERPPKAKLKKRASTEGGESATSAPSSGGEEQTEDAESNVKAERRLKLKLKLNNGNVSYNSVSIIDSSLDDESGDTSNKATISPGDDNIGNETRGDAEKSPGGDPGSGSNNNDEESHHSNGSIALCNNSSSSEEESCKDAREAVAEKPASVDTESNIPANVAEQNSQGELSEGSQLPDYSSLLDELPDLVGMEMDEEEGSRDTEKDDPDYLPTVDN